MPILRETVLPDMKLQALKLMLAPPMWKALSVSWRVNGFESQEEQGKSIIFACLHRDILPALCFVKPTHPSLLISKSTDGDILASTLGQRDYGFVRGSTGKGGGRALVGLRRCLENGQSIGLAVDGPRGPYGVVQNGILHLARLTGAPVLPLRATSAGALRLRTWDRTLVPLPGAKVHVTTGPVEYCSPGADEEELQLIKSRLELFFRGKSGGGT